MCFKRLPDRKFCSVHVIRCTYRFVRHTLKIISEEHQERGIPLKRERERAEKKEKRRMKYRRRVRLLALITSVYVGVSCTSAFLNSNSDVLVCKGKKPTSRFCDFGYVVGYTSSSDCMSEYRGFVVVVLPLIYAQHVMHSTGDRSLSYEASLPI